MTAKRILVATDFSPAGDLAVRRATALAVRLKAALRLVHAVPPLGLLEGLLPSRQQWSEEVAARAAAALKAQAALITDKRVRITTGLLTGRASAAIANAVKDYKPDLVVVGARGEGRLPNTKSGLGGTASKLIRSVEAPLLLVRRPEDDVPNHVLAAVDLTAASAEVVRWAKKISVSGKLTAIHVFEAPFAERLGAYGVAPEAINVYAADQHVERQQAMREFLARLGMGSTVNGLVVRGSAVKTISAQLRKLHIDTLVIGKHTRRKRNATSPYGSVCHYLTYFSPVDVLVVP